MPDQKLTFNAPVTIRFNGEWCSSKCRYREAAPVYGGYGFCSWFMKRISIMSRRTLRCSKCINFERKIKEANNDQ